MGPLMMLPMITDMTKATMPDPTDGKLSSIKRTRPSVTSPCETGPCHVFARRSFPAPARSSPQHAPQ